MKYRAITRTIAKFYLLESSIILVIVLVVPLFLARVVQVYEGQYIIIALTYLPLVAFCCYCVQTDEKFRNATARGTAPDFAIENCKSSLRLEKITFRLRLTYILVKLLFSSLNIFNEEDTNNSSMHELNIYWALMLIISVILFPLLQGLTVSTCLYKRQKLSLCHDTGTAAMCAVVVLRGISLFLAIKYNQHLQLVKTQTVVSNNNTNRMRTGRPDGRATCPEARINIIPTVFNITHEMRHVPFTQLENTEMPNGMSDLPSYEDVMNQNPPSYASIFNNSRL